MEFKESEDLKPLYSQLKRIYLGKLLQTKEFDLLTIEWRIDILWRDCLQSVSNQKDIFAVFNTDDYEKAYFYMISFYYLNNKHQELENLLFKTLCKMDLVSRIKVNYLGVLSELINREHKIMSPEIVKKLKSAINKFNEIKPETFSEIASKKLIEMKNLSKKIFIVHGHNDSLKLEVARILEKLELIPIILHEKANSGKTIIEKIEKHSNVDFAIVLLTADDKGGKIDSSEINNRARQNVILELGYFIGKLGRENVVPIYEKGVELPSDMNGVVYIEFDANSKGWKLDLVGELKEAGYDVDANKII